MLQTPVLFIIFNRPETTQQVFEAIRQAKPKQLFVAADGPREGKDGEQERCNLARQIATQVDWDCELKTLFRQQNRGCGLGPAEGITWFFDHVEQGIILEDDCLPDPSFFTFCEELLNFYKDDDRVMHISGNNFQYGRKVGNASYYFSKYSHNWGWASWKRAWQHYQFRLYDVDDFLQSSLFKTMIQSPVERTFWENTLGELRNGKEDVWDGQWQYSIWKANGLCILPNKNLVTNIGFGKDATHTFNTDSMLAKIPASSISRIKHPDTKDINKEADHSGFEKAFLLKTETNLYRRLKNKVLSLKKQAANK